jgi:Domain of unknown function (DUF1995)
MKPRNCFRFWLVAVELTVLTLVRDWKALNNGVYAFTAVRSSHRWDRTNSLSALLSASATTISPGLLAGQPTELPDSLADAAIRAAEASVDYCRLARGGGLDVVGNDGAPPARCRVDFDTSIGDETYTMLKQSTEFMQQFVTAISYALVPNLQQQRQEELMRVASAKAELAALRQKSTSTGAGTTADAVATAETTDSPSAAMTNAEREQREDELVEVIQNGGRDPTQPAWNGGVTRIYFPDEGSAALARRDWAPFVPACVQYSSCGSIQLQDTSKDVVQLFFCPRAAESDSVESILQATEMKDGVGSNALQLTVFVNPILVDMGVTGFGMAGRRLRERLLDTLVGTYYLRTLPWGALTRQWPGAYTVWQEDTNAVGGYKLITSLDRLPSNPEVEDIYDVANGNLAARQSGGFLDQLGDFVNGMMRL